MVSPTATGNRHGQLTLVSKGDVNHHINRTGEATLGLQYIVMSPLDCLTVRGGNGGVGRELFIDQRLEDVMNGPTSIRIEAIAGESQADLIAGTRPAFVINWHGIQ